MVWSHFFLFLLQPTKWIIHGVITTSSSSCQTTKILSYSLIGASHHDLIFPISGNHLKPWCNVCVKEKRLFYFMASGGQERLILEWVYCHQGSHGLYVNEIYKCIFVIITVITKIIIMVTIKRLHFLKSIQTRNIGQTKQQHNHKLKAYFKV